MMETQEAPTPPTLLLLPPSTRASSSSSALLPVPFSFQATLSPHTFPQNSKATWKAWKPRPQQAVFRPRHVAPSPLGGRWAMWLPPPSEQMCSRISAPFSPTGCPRRRFWLDWA